MRRMNTPLTALLVVTLLAGNLAAAPSATGRPADHEVQAQTVVADHVSGTITYRERIALPPDAQISVQILDVSRADAPATVIAQDDFLAGGNQVPFEFSLPYDPLMIDPSHRYVVRATIRAGGRLWFTTTESHPVITAGSNWVDLVLTNVMSSNPGGQTTTNVNGTITYLQRIALPDNAVLTVKLLDVSRADAPAIVVSEASLPTGGNQVPFSFSLPFDPAEIDDRNTYVVRAEIHAAGRLLFTTDRRYQVITRGQPTTVQIVLAMVGGDRAPDAPVSGLTAQPWVWTETIAADGTVIRPNRPGDTLLRLSADGSMGLRTDCNSFFGQYDVSGSTITFSQMGGTLIACPPGSKESVVIGGFQQATSYALTNGGANLEFGLADGGRMFFTAQ